MAETPFSVDLDRVGSLTRLRAASLDMRVENGVHVVPGVYLGWDAEGCEVSLRIAPGAGLLRVAGRMSGAPRWIALHVELGRIAFEAGNVLGLVADLQAVADLGPRRVALRSYDASDAARDVTLADNFAVTDHRETRVALLRLAAGSAALGGEMFRTLMLELPAADFDIVIHDLRCMIVPGTGYRPLTPSSTARQAI